MARMSKRMKAIAEKVDRNRQYPAAEAFALLNELASVVGSPGTELEFAL